MEDLQAIRRELAEIKATLLQNKIKPISEEEEQAYPQPATAEEFAVHIKNDVKNLPVFNGEGHPSLNEWLTDVAPLISNMDRLIPNTYDYHYFLREIRRKIQGQAGEMLTNYGVILKWTSIKKALVSHFAEKRNLNLLEIQALTLKQGKSSLEYYYKQANELLTKTVEAIRLSEDIDELATASHMKIARQRILCCFVNGLNIQMELQCKALKPKSLEEAFSICNEIRNSSKLKNLLEANTIHNQKKGQSFSQANATSHKTEQTQQAKPNWNRGPTKSTQSVQNPPSQKRRNSEYFETKNSGPTPMEVDPSLRTSWTKKSDTAQRIYQLLHELAETEKSEEDQNDPTQGDSEDSDIEEETESEEVNFLV